MLIDTLLYQLPTVDASEIRQKQVDMCQMSYFHAVLHVSTFFFAGFCPMNRMKIY